MNELCHLPGFRHDAKLIEETGQSHISFNCSLSTVNVYPSSVSPQLVTTINSLREISSNLN